MSGIGGLSIGDRDNDSVTAAEAAYAAAAVEAWGEYARTGDDARGA